MDFADNDNCLRELESRLRPLERKSSMGGTTHKELEFLKIHVIDLKHNIAIADVTATQRAGLCARAQDLGHRVEILRCRIYPLSLQAQVNPEPHSFIRHPIAFFKTWYSLDH